MLASERTTIWPTVAPSVGTGRPSTSTTRTDVTKPSRPHDCSRSGWTPLTAAWWSSWERKHIVVPSVCP